MQEGSYLCVYENNSNRHYMRNLIDWYIKHYRQGIVRGDDELISPLNITQKSLYMDCCNNADSAECIGNYYGRIKRYLNKEQAENLFFE